MMQRSWRYSYLLTLVVCRPCTQRNLSQLTMVPRFLNFRPTSKMFCVVGLPSYISASRLGGFPSSMFPLGLILSHCVRMALLFGVRGLLVGVSYWFSLLIGELQHMFSYWGWKLCEENISLQLALVKWPVSNYYPWDARAYFFFLFCCRG